MRVDPPDPPAPESPLFDQVRDVLVCSRYRRRQRPQVFQELISLLQVPARQLADDKRVGHYETGRQQSR